MLPDTIAPSLVISTSISAKAMVEHSLPVIHVYPPEHGDPVALRRPLVATLPYSTSPMEEAYLCHSGANPRYTTHV